MMISTDHVYREAQRRRHRTLGLYLALEAWKRGFDCVALRRSQLLPFLGLKRMWNQRVDWLAEDVHSYFPFHWRTVTQPGNVYATIYLSRRKLPLETTDGRMSDDARVTLMSKKGLSSGLIAVPKESDLVAQIARLSHGMEG